VGNAPKEMGRGVVQPVEHTVDEGVGGVVEVSGGVGVAVYSTVPVPAGGFEGGFARKFGGRGVVGCHIVTNPGEEFLFLCIRQ